MFDDITTIDPEDTKKIPPLVYVQDFSTNGTFLRRAATITQTAMKEQQLSRQNGRILLAPGDHLRICPNMEFEFRYTGSVNPNADPLSPLQRCEAKVFL